MLFLLTAPRSMIGTPRGHGDLTAVRRAANIEPKGSTMTEYSITAMSSIAPGIRTENGRPVVAALAVVVHDNPGIRAPLPDRAQGYAGALNREGKVVPVFGREPGDRIDWETLPPVNGRGPLSATVESTAPDTTVRIRSLATSHADGSESGVTMSWSLSLDEADGLAQQLARSVAAARAAQR
ncbi:hypothetical protein CQY22_013250 [Mycolicibacterium brumae]|uniref:Uncharacterized protein n=1 Tax=Mycolicibacterium brumae TaxID=85968 RepID=A0A2G5P7T1_9MYCO|nr:hypothetical protein CQY22_013250 [Mycolicibacterium brumae]RWA22712.1 hypothetical protein MBRU_12240 [Mycolicibacterium brumae DSM 44177]